MPDCIVLASVYFYETTFSLVRALGSLGKMFFMPPACFFFLQVVALVPVEGGSWVCFSWDIEARVFTICDPGCLNKTTSAVQMRHMQRVGLMQTGLLMSLRMMHGRADVGDGMWKPVCHVDIGRGCVRYEFCFLRTDTTPCLCIVCLPLLLPVYSFRHSSGVFAITCARNVDCATGNVAIENYDIPRCTKDLLYKLLHSTTNSVRDYVMKTFAEGGAAQHDDVPAGGSGRG